MEAEAMGDSKRARHMADGTLRNFALIPPAPAPTPGSVPESESGFCTRSDLAPLMYRSRAARVTQPVYPCPTRVGPSSPELARCWPNFPDSDLF